ncbi:phosphatases II, partial [Ascodesmis nigricans]
MTDPAPNTETTRLDRSYLRRNPNLMDEIIPGLYLGSLEAAVDHPLLAANKITHILSLTSTPIPVPPPKNIHHTHHIVRDSKTSNLMEILLSSLETIENAFTVRILVHCRMGISRSASVVLAYLLKHHSHENLNSALKFLSSVRPCVNPNQGFRSQLEILSSVKFDQGVIRELGLLDLG